MNKLPHRTARTQRGASTLLIAMLLLAILTVASIFATAYGVHEQRTSGNEYRYKMAFQAAEAGLNQSIEYVKVNTQTMLSTASSGWLDPGAPRWQPCTSNAPSSMPIDPCLAEPDATRRASMYRYVGNTGGVLPLSESLPANQTFTGLETGSSGFETTYKTYATLCRLDISTTPRCSLTPTTEGTFYVTIVSTGSLTDEQTTASVKQSFGTFRLLGGAPAAPIIAAGTSIGLGNSQIVPNPDAAGFGIPVSIWAKGDASVAGASFASCQLGEWLASDTGADLINGVCKDCTCNKLCPGYGLLSGNSAYCGTGLVEGEDVLDDEGANPWVSHASPKVRNSRYFPDDLFEYIFAVPWTSKDDVKKMAELTDCSNLTTASSGLYWFENAGGTCTLKESVGSVQNPVVLVSDGQVTFSDSNLQFFGIIFVTKNAPAEGFKATGGQVYGSVILEGNAGMAGGPTIVYNKAVLSNIGNSNNFLRYGPIPGSWSDTVINN